MSTDSTSDIRISLPAGTVIRSANNIYQVQKMICMSERSTTVLCTNGKNELKRVKLFCGKNSMNRKIVERLAALPVQGIARVEDTGEYSGYPFYVASPLSATDTSKYPVAQDLLFERVIPQMAYVVAMYHRNRVVLRDICPEHILYDTNRNTIQYCGFSNATILADKATVTKEPGYGQHFSYLAPEALKYGYSFYSDYYALGITILSLVYGKNPMASMTWDEYIKSMQQGKIPGIDVARLQCMPYHLYSMQDKILYLVLGLIQPDPKNRWGYGEIRCWCNNQEIPLVRKDGRIAYQYSTPFQIGNVKCWNDRQIAEVLAANGGAWSEDTLKRLSKFAHEQKTPNWDKVESTLQEPNLKAQGKIFRCIYGLNPALNGLWWRGIKYNDTTSLIQNVSKDGMAKNALTEMLQDHCLSFLLKMRSRISKVDIADIREFEDIENWEISEPTKGVNRCVMRYAANTGKRTFTFEGQSYPNLQMLLDRYAGEPQKLKRICRNVIENNTFQAWLWAEGLEDAGTRAVEICRNHPEQAFFLLLQLAESGAKNEKDKQKARLLYLKYGEFAPIYWLSQNLDKYRATSSADQTLPNRFRNAGLTVDQPLEKISRIAEALTVSYESFVAGTAEGPLEIECADSAGLNFSYHPVSEDCFFCCKWENGIEVSPAFLYSIGESVKSGELESWIDKSKETARKMLTTVIDTIPKYHLGKVSTIGAYRGICVMNMIAAVCTFLAVWFAETQIVAGTYSFRYMPYNRNWGLIVFAIFPLISIVWYFVRMQRAGNWFRYRNSIDQQAGQYSRLLNQLDSRADEIVNNITKCKSVTVKEFCRTGTFVPMNDLYDIDGTQLPKKYALLGVISAIGLFLAYDGFGVDPSRAIFNTVILAVGMIKGADSTVKWSLGTLFLACPLMLEYAYGYYSDTAAFFDWTSAKTLTEITGIIIMLLIYAVNKNGHK